MGQRLVSSEDHGLLLGCRGPLRRACAAAEWRHLGGCEDGIVTMQLHTHMGARTGQGAANSGIRRLPTASCTPTSPAPPAPQIRTSGTAPRRTSNRGRLCAPGPSVQFLDRARYVRKRRMKRNPHRIVHTDAIEATGAKGRQNDLCVPNCYSNRRCFGLHALTPADPPGCHQYDKID